MKFEELLEKAYHWVVYVTVFLVPLTVLPIFVNPYATSKLTVLTGGVAISLILKVFKAVISGKVKISVGTFDFAVVLFAAIYALSGYFRTPNSMEAFFLPGVATIFIFGAILYFLINQMGQNGKRGLEMSLILSAASVSFVSVLSGAGVFASIAQLPDFMKDLSFNTVGGSLGGFIFLLSVFPLSAAYIIQGRDAVKKSVFGVLMALILIGVAISFVNSLPGRVNSPKMAGFNDSWIVAIEAIKNNPLLGVGPGNYLTAFNRFRPQSYNATELWQLRFSSARSFYLTTITETGVLGLVALGAVLYQVYKNYKQFINKNRDFEINAGNSISWGRYSGLAIGLVLLAVFSSSLTLVVLLFVFLALITHTTENNFGLDTSNGSKLAAYIVSAPIVVFVLGWGFWAQKTLAAERVYTRALAAVSANDGLASYTLLQQAIAHNPQVDRYHTSYAQINLALANSLASQENITDQDRNNISQLVQQAIREGKSSVALNPARANNWEVLASIYRAIIPLAEGADQFAIQTYSQAIALDPLNPQTRISLGGIYYSAGDFESAIDVFRLATLVKPDHANAHYNLAVAYREAGQIERAINEMSIVLSLVDGGSDDFGLAQTTLQDLQNRRAAARPNDESSSNLTPPAGPQTPELDPPIELPDDAGPPEDPSPSVAPSPTPMP